VTIRNEQGSVAYAPKRLDPGPRRLRLKSPAAREVSLPRSASLAAGRVALAAGALAVLAYGYGRFARDRVVNWGATLEEVSDRFPGDELLEAAEVITTRAITIHAPPSAIWPWLVQMGVGRAGAYTYDRIERLLGVDIHNIDEIVPELQDLKLGDVLPMQPNKPGMRVEVLDRERAMSVRSEDGAWVWSFVLLEQDGATRLISRNRIALSDRIQRVGTPAMELGSLVMERKMLRTIRTRAEGLAAQQAAAPRPQTPPGR